MIIIRIISNRNLKPHLPQKDGAAGYVHIPMKEKNFRRTSSARGANMEQLILKK